MKKQRLMKKMLGFILVIILAFSFTTTAYANDEIIEMYNELFAEYTLSGTVIDKDYNGILVELDNPISYMFSMDTINYGYIKGNWNLSIGDKFNPSTKFQMFDVTTQDFTVIGIFEQSVGSIKITPPEEQYVSDKDMQYTLGWMDEVIAKMGPYTPNSDKVIFFKDVWAIDEEGPIEEGMDMSLFRVYVDNPGYMCIGVEAPTYNEYSQKWTYHEPRKMIQDFKNAKNTIVKNNTYYIPMKELVEYYGHSVTWTPETGVMISNYLQITSGSNIVKNLRDGIDITLSNNIEIIDGTTYVPIEFLKEVFPENGFKWTTQDRGNGCISIDITQEIVG